MDVSGVAPMGRPARKRHSLDATGRDYRKDKAFVFAYPLRFVSFLKGELVDKWQRKRHKKRKKRKTMRP